jgi:hypothetical protein
VLGPRAPRTFYPHGLGHPVGLDVHDPTPSPWVLTPGQVFTVEPGIYFIDMLLQEARDSASISRYFNWPLIDSDYTNFGGVRPQARTRAQARSHVLPLPRCASRTLS